MKMLMLALVFVIGCSSPAATAKGSPVEECLTALVKAYRGHNHTLEGRVETSGPQLAWTLADPVRSACKAFLD